MNKKEFQIKCGIISLSLLAMGAISLNSTFAVLSEHFRVSSTTIAFVSSIPCIIVIIVTLFLGNLLNRFSQRIIGIAGACCFLFGGLVPLFYDSLVLLFICRGILGIGVAISQVTMATIPAEHFTGEKRAAVNGLAQSAQFLGMIIMCLLSGVLASLNWRLSYLVHLIGLFTLFVLLFIYPKEKQNYRNIPDEKKQVGEKTKITKAAVAWLILMFFTFLLLLVYTNNLSFLLEEKSIGGSSFAGITIAVEALAGLIVGLIYGKIDQKIGIIKLPFTFVIFVLAYLVIIFAKTMVGIYIGAILMGSALSLFMPQMFLYSSLSVETYSVPVVLSLLISAQNLGQILCPFANDYLANILAPEGHLYTTKMIIALICLAILSIITFIYAIQKKRIR